jgi:hypothetical protein
LVHSLAPAAGALRGAPERSPWHSRHSASQCAAQLLLKQQHSHLQRPRCLPRRRKRTSSAAEGDRARVSGLLRTLARCEWFEWRTAHLSHTTAACSHVLPSKRRMSALSAGCQELSRARCSTLRAVRWRAAGRADRQGWLGRRLSSIVYIVYPLWSNVRNRKPQTANHKPQTTNHKPTVSLKFPQNHKPPPRA